jgi:hypothetical protein
MNSRKKREERIAALTPSERQEIRTMIEKGETESLNFRIRRDDRVVCRRTDGAPRIAPAEMFLEPEPGPASSQDPPRASFPSSADPIAAETRAGGLGETMKPAAAQPTAGPDTHGTDAPSRSDRSTRRFAQLAGVALVACVALYWVDHKNAHFPHPAQVPAHTSPAPSENAVSASHFSALGAQIPSGPPQVTSNATEEARGELNAAKETIQRQQVIIDSLRLSNAILEERLHNLEMAHKQEKREAQERYARSVVEENRAIPR